jgi:hypothetical protein
MRIVRRIIFDFVGFLAAFFAVAIVLGILSLDGLIDYSFWIALVIYVWPLRKWRLAFYASHGAGPAAGGAPAAPVRSPGGVTWQEGSGTGPGRGSAVGWGNGNGARSDPRRFIGANDPLAGTPLAAGEHVWVCRCGVGYHQDSYLELQRVNEGRCVTCESHGSLNQLQLPAS